MVVVEGDLVGQIVLRGAGAGEGPTASAVMSDLVELARGVRMPVFGQPAERLAVPQPARTAVPAAYYLRLTLADKPGALAKVATVLGDAGISIDRMRQYGHTVGGSAPVLIVTHKTTPRRSSTQWNTCPAPAWSRASRSSCVSKRSEAGNGPRQLAAGLSALRPAPAAGGAALRHVGADRQPQRRFVPARSAARIMRWWRGASLRRIFW